MVGMVVGEEDTCPDLIVPTLREIRDAIRDPTSCTARIRNDETVNQLLRQHGEVVASLLAQTESLQKAATAVAEVQNGHKQLILALRSELETEKQAKRAQRRTLQDLRSQLHVLKEENKAWQEAAGREKSEMRAGLRRLDEAVKEMEVDLKGTSERTGSLGEVIRQLQGSIQGLQRTVTRHSSTLRKVRKGAASRLTPEDPAETTTSPAALPLHPPPEGTVMVDCPHPYSRIGQGCFGVHSSNQHTWEEARQHCRDTGGDLAHPSDLYDIILFLDNSFPGAWGFWVGATLDDDDSWHWVSGVPLEPPPDFWGRGEPGEALAEEERCLFLHGWWRFRAGAGQCEEKKYFLCEMKMG